MSERRERRKRRKREDQIERAAPDQIPHSVPTERALLGSVLINPPAIATVRSLIDREDFYLLRHQYIWDVMVALDEAGDPIDYMLLAEGLAESEKLDLVGGEPYLIQLSNETPNSAYFEVYARMIQRLSMRRKLMHAAARIHEAALDEERSTEDILEDAEIELANAGERLVHRDWRSGYELASDAFDTQDDRLGKPTLPTGFNQLDELVKIQQGDLAILAGRPGMGKTSLALSIVQYLCEQGYRVGVFTMEMGADQLAMRLIGAMAQIEINKLRERKLTHSESKRFTYAIGKLSEWHVYINDNPSVTPEGVRSSVRKLQQSHGVDFVIVDHIGLMTNAQNFKNRVESVTYTSRYLKETARKLGLPVLVLSQLNRSLESRSNKRPILSDLRESGSLEQDADYVWFLYRDRVYNEATEFPNQAELIVAKNRHGPTGVATLYFEAAYTSFADARIHHIALSELD